ncbi:MAG TPA: hypothetical protein VFS92_04465 [Planctomycetota bacterium]|nr:hypothetical protein [Planctomycetota bacterium]
MTARATSLSILAGLAVLAATAAGVIAFRGGEGWAIRGVVLGTGLGAAGSAVEAWLVAEALRRPKGQALSVVLMGFGFRLAFLLGATLVLDATGLADPVSFALCFLGGFLASLPVLAAAAGGGRVPNGGAAS